RLSRERRIGIRDWRHTDSRRRFHRVVTLLASDLVLRARALRLVVTDVDGVLTDATVYYSARGEELLRFSRRDGMGVELLARAGLRTAIVSRENSAIVRARATKLGLSLVYLGVRNKGEFLSILERETDVARDAMAYIGDDVVDVEIMRAVAIAAAPSDAIE